MVSIPLFTGFYTSQVVVWDFFHQQYGNESPRKKHQRFFYKFQGVGSGLKKTIMQHCQTVGMPAQVSKFGENKPFTNRNVCFGSRNKPLAAHETFVLRFKTNLFRGQMAIQWLHEMSSSFCAKQSAGKLNFGHRKVCFRHEN